MQESAGARSESLRLDDVREERVHGSAAALLQDCQSQAFRGNCLLPLQVNRTDSNLFFNPLATAEAYTAVRTSRSRNSRTKKKPRTAFSVEQLQIN